jgi:signal transduction histidine kinase
MIKEILKLLLLVFCSTHVYCVCAQTGHPLLRNYTPQEYGQAPQVFSLFQDRAGFLYAGIPDVGLIQYDGVSWREIPTRDRTAVWSMTEGNDGVIYVGGVNDFGKLVLNASGRYQYVSMKSLLKDSLEDINSVWSVMSTSDRVYFMTYASVYSYNPRANSIKTFQADTLGKFFGAFTDHDTYFVRLSKVGILQLKDDTLTLAPGGEFFKNKNSFLYGVMEYRDPVKLIATRTNGLYFYNTLRDSTAGPIPVSDPDVISDNFIFTAKRIGRDHYLLGTFDKGAYSLRSDGEVTQEITEDQSLQNNSVNAILVDQSQNVWMGLSIGMSKVTGHTDITHWDKRNGLLGSVYDLLRIEKDLYVSTENSVFRINSQGKVFPINGLVPGQTWDVASFKSKQGNRLVVAHQNGMYELENDRARLVHNSIDQVYFVFQIPGSDRVILTDMPHLLSYRVEKGKWIAEGKWEGIEGNLRSIEMDDKGVLWVGTFNNGVIRVEPNPADVTKPKSVRYLGTSDGLPSLTGCVPFRIGNELVFGTERGLYQWNERAQKFEPWCKFGNAFCDGSRGVFRMDASAEDTILICSRNNKSTDIGYLVRNGSGYDWNYRPFRRLPYITALYALLQENGRYWVGGSEGLFRYDPSADDRNYNQSFPCYVRQVTVGDSVCFYGDVLTSPSIEFQGANSTIDFSFAAPFFDQEETMLYSYRLIGFDSNWSPWSAVTSKQYTNLFEGNYTFEVKAINIYDVESTVATFTFTALPPWYRTWWAYGGYGVGFIFLIVLIVQGRTRRLNREKLVLERRVAERTAALQKSEHQLRQNVEELNATLENLSRTQMQLMASEKMASLGQLTAGIAHEINNPLNFISGGVQALEGVSDDLKKLSSALPEASRTRLDDCVQEMNEMMRVILSGIERSSKIIQSLRVFANPSEVIPEENNLNIIECVEGSLTIMMGKLREYRIRIVRELNEVPHIRGNAPMLNQIWINLIDNAIQALEATPEPTITIKTYQQDGWVVVSVRDNGPGIPQEVQSMIMNPFFTTKDVGKGTGLGLSISFGIVQKHHGKLTFFSEPGKGAEFLVFLPV